jgi:hypothetical protein
LQQRESPPTRFAAPGAVPGAGPAIRAPPPRGNVNTMSRRDQQHDSCSDRLYSSSERSIHAVFSWTCMRCVSRSHVGWSLTLSDDALTIQGERRHEREEKRKGFYRSERSYGSFFRQIPLPEGTNPGDAKAAFKNGVLEVTMPAPPKPAKGRAIPIEEA